MEKVSDKKSEKEIFDQMSEDLDEFPELDDKDNDMDYEDKLELKLKLEISEDHKKEDSKQNHSKFWNVFSLSLSLSSRKNLLSLPPSLLVMKYILFVKTH